MPNRKQRECVVVVVVVVLESFVNYAVVCIGMLWI